MVRNLALWEFLLYTTETHASRELLAGPENLFLSMEQVDLKLVLLGVFAAPGSPQPSHRDTTVATRVCAGQPGVGKTCLVYRYLYNTFGETISVRGATRFSRHSDLRAAAAS